ncbi:MAG: type III secretion system stator protein SctL [Deltaproteobacteria bacterium]|jgi:type III secretion system HrpE/YscL family protein
MGRALPKVIKRASQAPEPSRPQAPQMKKRRVIERELVDATKEATRIRREAEDAAQRILEEAEEQAVETRQHGFEEGKQEGLAQYTQQVAQALLRVKKVEDGLEASYVGLVTECVEKIIGEAVKIDSNVIVGVVRRALLDARQQREIIVRVHPTDKAALEQNKNKLLEILARANAVEIREDASVTRGGCMIMTELGAIDAQLERQLEAMQAALQAELTEAELSGYDMGELDPEDDPGAGY